MPKLEKIEMKPAATAQIAPVNLTNPSPFPRRKEPNDPIRTILLVVSAVAVLTFLGSMIAVLMLHAPTP